MALLGETQVVVKEKNAMWALGDNYRYDEGEKARRRLDASAVMTAMGWDVAKPMPISSNPGHATLDRLLKFTPGRFDGAHYMHEVASASELPVIERLKRRASEPGRGELEAQTRGLNRASEDRMFDREGGILLTKK